MLDVDHVIVAVRDLTATADRMLDTYGLASVEGGAHEEWGTANRLVPIGDQYLELLAVADESTRHPIADAVRAASADGDSLMGVCCEVDDIAARAERLGSALIPGMRRLPDGTPVTWRLTGVDGALGRGLPFFIQWDQGRESRMSTVEPDHRVAPQRIARVDLGGDPAALADWLGEASPALRALGGPPGLRAVVVATSTGDLVVEG